METHAPELICRVGATCGTHRVTELADVLTRSGFRLYQSQIYPNPIPEDYPRLRSLFFGDLGPKPLAYLDTAQLYGDLPDLYHVNPDLHQLGEHRNRLVAALSDF